MNRSILQYLIPVVLVVSVFSCKPKDKLVDTIEVELASGERYDSLFLGIQMGMNVQEFYDQCWKINRQGLVREGPSNMSVEYIFNDSLDNPIAFNFYPEKKDGDEIHKYLTSFYYYGWAPWNKHLQSDKLFEMVPSILMDWHGGNEPFEVIKDGKKHIYKIDGNRMIDIYIIDEKIVGSVYSDNAFYYKPAAH